MEARGVAVDLLVVGNGKVQGAMHMGRWYFWSKARCYLRGGSLWCYRPWVVPSGKA